MTVNSKTGPMSFETDEHVRADANLAAMAKLKPAFDAQGTVTAGNRGRAQ